MSLEDEKKALEALVKLLTHNDPDVRIRAALAILNRPKYA